MASHAVLEHDIGGVQCLVFCAFPLHNAGKPSRTRAAHLAEIALPMLFLSGTRDALAEPELLAATVDELGTRATLHWLDTADHSYKVLKRSRKSTTPIFDEMADRIVDFVARGSRGV
jgi:predicted alpha/beta-hydrolase family hydrolase